MNALQLRKKLHTYIDNAAEKKLKAIYTMVEDEMPEIKKKKQTDKKETKSLLTNEQKRELDKRMVEYKQGKGKTYSWNEAKAIIYRKTNRPAQK